MGWGLWGVNPREKDDMSLVRGGEGVVLKVLRGLNQQQLNS